MKSDFEIINGKLVRSPHTHNWIDISKTSECLVEMCSSCKSYRMLYRECAPFNQIREKIYTESTPGYMELEMSYGNIRK